MSRRTGPAAPLALAATLLLALLWLFPLAWTVSTSLKDSFQTIVVPPRWLPSPVSFAEYSRIVTTGQVTIWLLNSLLTAGLVTVLTVGISAAAAYAFSQLRFPGHGLLFWLFLASLMVPFEALVVPLYQQVNAMGLVNTVVPLADLEAETLRWCREMLALSPWALRLSKLSFHAHEDGYAGIQQLAHDANLLFYGSAEAQEGREAFKERRPPDFTRFPRRP